MKHILVVEDEEHLAVGIKYNLQAEGYRATTVGNGPAALQFIKDESDGIDLLILDLMLPGMSGYAVCDALRADGRDIPVLILSARSLSEDRARAFEAGANQYLTKPFELDELLSRVKNLLTLRGGNGLREAGASASVVQFGFGTSFIDFETHEVKVGDEMVRLTSLELKLLRYFVDHEGRVIPRDELLEKVWSMPGTLATRAPDQFIRRLRKIFEPDPAHPRHFLTIRDAGYRFVAVPAVED